jgi:hypothetical protein
MPVYPEKRTDGELETAIASASNGSYSGCDLTDSRLSLVQRHGIDENAGVVTLAVQRSQSSGFTLPHQSPEGFQRCRALAGN